MSAPAFVNAALDTALIEREREHLFAPRGETSREMWELAAQATWLAQRRKALSGAGTSPWDGHGAWALGVRGDRRLKLREGELEREVAGPFSGGEAPGTFVVGNEVHLFDGGEHRVFEWIDPYLPVQNTPTLTAACSQPCPAGCWPYT